MWFRWVNLTLGFVIGFIGVFCLLAGSPTLAALDFCLAGINFYAFYKYTEELETAPRPLNREAGEKFRTGSWATGDKEKDGWGRDEVT